MRKLKKNFLRTSFFTEHFEWLLVIPDNDNPAGELQECYTTRWGLLAYRGFPSDYLHEV